MFRGVQYRAKGENALLHAAYGVIYGSNQCALYKFGTNIYDLRELRIYSYGLGRLTGLLIVTKNTLIV